MKRRIAVHAAVVALALGPATMGSPGGKAGVALAQTPSPASRPAVPAAGGSALDAQVAAVSATLRCPVCQGESIQDSPSALAQEMRAVVRERLSAGESPDEVKAYFVSKYGEWILLEPTMQGLNILLYAFPVLLVIAGLALVFVLVRRWTAPQAEAE